MSWLIRAAPPSPPPPVQGAAGEKDSSTDTMIPSRETSLEMSKCGAGGGAGSAFLLSRTLTKPTRRAFPHSHNHGRQQAPMGAVVGLELREEEEKEGSLDHGTWHLFHL